MKLVKLSRHCHIRSILWHSHWFVIDIFISDVVIIVFVCEQVMRSIAEPASAEGGIARRAFDRLTDTAAELQLDANIVELAHQVSCSISSCL